MEDFDDWFEVLCTSFIFSRPEPVDGMEEYFRDAQHHAAAADDRDVIPMVEVHAAQGDTTQGFPDVVTEEEREGDAAETDPEEEPDEPLNDDDDIPLVVVGNADQI